jgi:glycosyltransferase involved in cell wall biosynthesis
MKVLFATPSPPLLIKPRPYHFIRGLAHRGHAVHLLMQLPSERAVSELSEAPGWGEIVELCSSVSWVVVPRLRSYTQCVMSLPTRTPLRVAYCRSPAFTLRARRLIQQHDCDVLHVDRKRIAPALSDLPLPKILDATDSITLYTKRLLKHGSSFDRLVSIIELLKFPSFEAEVCRGFSACLATTDEDARALQSSRFDTTLEVLCNGVDERLFRCAPKDGTDSLLFVGGMYYPPNIDAATWFTKHVFPRIKAVKPQTQLHLVGSRPTRAVRRLARISGVEVTGTVRDIGPYLEYATVFVAPIRIGGGFPNKIAEALAAGVPTVATPAAHAGIPDLVPGAHLIEATNSEEFASRTLQLLEDAGLRNRLRVSGRDFMRTGYGWDEVVERLENIYISSIASWHTTLGPTWAG